MKSPGGLQGIGQQPLVLCFKVSTFNHASCPAEHTKSWKKKYSIHLLTVVRLFSFSYHKFYLEMFALRCLPLVLSPIPVLIGNFYTETCSDWNNRQNNLMNVMKGRDLGGSGLACWISS